MEAHPPPPHLNPPLMEKVLIRCTRVTRWQREAWLSGTLDEAWETLTPYPDDLMVAWPPRHTFIASFNYGSQFAYLTFRRKSRWGQTNERWVTGQYSMRVHTQTM
jgi:hypothetical protein